MTDEAPVTQPYTLWFETLPSNDTARLLVSLRSRRFHVTLYWNQKYHSERSFATLEDAEAWGYKLHTVVMHDALAGALLGYDPEVVSRLADAVPLT